MHPFKSFVPVMSTEITQHAETSKNMRVTKAKTSEFRFSVTDLIPVDNGIKLKKDSKKLSSVDAPPISRQLNYGTRSLELTSLGRQKTEVTKTNSLSSARGNFKVLLGNEKDGAVLDLDTFLRVQQWVEDASKRLISEQTANDDKS